MLTRSHSDDIRTQIAELEQKVTQDRIDMERMFNEINKLKIKKK